MTKTIKLESQTAASETVTGPKTSVNGFSAGVAFLSVTAATGTTPTLDCVVQHSADGVVWFTLATFTQATAATTETKTLSNFGEFIRVVQTIGGTDPAFTYTIYVTLK